MSQLLLDENGNGQAPDGTTIVNFKTPTGVDVRNSGAIVNTIPSSSANIQTPSVNSTPATPTVSTTTSPTASTIAGNTGGWTWDTSSWNPKNWSIWGFNMVPFDNDWIKSKGFDPTKITPDQRKDLFQLYQNEQKNGMLQNALGWGNIGQMVDIGATLIKPFFDYKNYQLAKDNLNYMKKQGERNWRATVTNYNDRASALNWGSSSFDGGLSRNRYRTIS